MVKEEIQKNTDLVVENISSNIVQPYLHRISFNRIERQHNPKNSFNPIYKLAQTSDSIQVLQKPLVESNIQQKNFVIHLQKEMQEGRIEQTQYKKLLAEHEQAMRKLKVEKQKKELRAEEEKKQSEEAKI